jgi:small-conductance mechanosensitive channel
MGEWVRLVGPNRAVQVFGVKLVGVNASNGNKVLFSLAFILLVILLGWTLKALARVLLRGRRNARVEFWTRQAIRLATAVLLSLGLISVWFDDPTRLATALGLVTAGLAFALQRVITALAGYIVILQGKTFNVGDRITMGGVRGDVIALGFIQTTIMEMGQPPAVQNADPAMWVRARQYTGRVVTVTNDKIFTEPVYNYSRDFPYIWEEMVLPISYTADRRRAEQVMLEVAERHTIHYSQLSAESIEEMQRRYFMKSADMRPKVFFRLTDNWLELTVRFIAEDYGIRDLKDAMSRDILEALEEAGIGIASATFEVVGLPPLRVESISANGLNSRS